MLHRLFYSLLLLVGWFSSKESLTWLKDVSGLLQPGQILYTFFYSSAIIFFCYFYTALVFNPKDTADNLKKSGAFVPGIRPGEQTTKYIENVVMRLTFYGSIYITFVCLIPEFLIIKWNVPFILWTSLLIIVVVTMDLMSQIQSHIMSKQYESLLKSPILSQNNHMAKEDTIEMQGEVLERYQTLLLRLNWKMIMVHAH